MILTSMTTNSKRKVRETVPQISPTELNRLLRHWPIVMRVASDDWAKEFAFSVWNQSGRKGWMPTLKQTKVMRTMVREARPYLH